MVATVTSNTLSETDIDALLYDKTETIRENLAAAGVVHPLIVWRNNRLMLSYFQTPAKQAANLRTLAKLQGKLQQHLAYSEGNAKAFCDGFISWVNTQTTPEHAADLRLYVGGSDDTLAMLVEVYGTDLRNYRGRGAADHSCMNHEMKHSLRHRDSNGTEIYPCMAYNHPSITLAVLYIDGEIAGRAITNTTEKQYYSRYTLYDAGYDDVMAAALDAAGFEQHGDTLDGCSLVTVLNGDGYPLMPYLDGNYDNAAFPDADNLEEGEPVTITYSRGYSCNHTTGTPDHYTTDRMECNECGERITDEDDENHTDHDGVLCDCCHSQLYTYANTGRWGCEYVRNSSNELYTYDGEVYTQRGLEYADLVVTENGDVIPECESVTYDGETYNIEDCTQCAITGEDVPDHLITTIAGLPLSPEAVKSHTTDGKLDAVRDFVYCNGEPTDADADSIINAVTHADFEYTQHTTDAVRYSMLNQYSADCALYCITHQLPLFAA